MLAADSPPEGLPCDNRLMSQSDQTDEECNAVLKYCTQVQCVHYKRLMRVFFILFISIPLHYFLEGNLTLVTFQNNILINRTSDSYRVYCAVVKKCICILIHISDKLTILLCFYFGIIFWIHKPHLISSVFYVVMIWVLVSCSALNIPVINTLRKLKLVVCHFHNPARFRLVVASSFTLWCSITWSGCTEQLMPVAEMIQHEH